MSDTPTTDHRLTTRQVADFVADGFLLFEGLIPDEINRAAMREIDEKAVPSHYDKQGQPLAGLWPDSHGFGALFRLPQVRGIIDSLVGPDPLYDHHAFHKVGPHHEEGQVWHADAIIDTRTTAFDIQLFYYPHDTPRAMGGTMFLPGSHFRRVNESDIGCYQNFVGQKPIVCRAGTLAVGHHGIWHCAQPNHTDGMRYMFKLRLNPTVKQERLWNASDLESPDTVAAVSRTLFRNHHWYGNEDRLEYAQRIKLWRALTGDARYDAQYWLTRLENEPTRRAVAATA